MRKLIFINLLLLVMIFLPSTALASVTDAASILSGAEISKLNSQIQQVEHKYGITINLVTQPSLNGKNIRDISKALINRVTDSQNSGVNGNIVLLIDMDKRKFQAEADRKLQPLLFDSDNNPRFDESGFISGFKKGDYFSGFSSYISQIDMTLANSQTENHNTAAASPYATNEPTNDEAGWFDPMAAMIAVVGAIIIGVMYRSSLIASMSNVRPAIEASEYLDKNNVNITTRRDNFLYVNVSRQPKSRGGNHGGSSGGGNSGGGHSGSF